jgi:hypothetical protein
MKRYIIAALACIVMDAHAEASPFSGGIGVLWESHYLSEGRDNLDNTGLFSSTVEWGGSTALGDWSLGSWYASGYDTDYTEWNLSAGWTRAMGDLEISAGYTYLRFLSDSEDDHEVGLDLAYTGFGAWTPFIGGYYSFEAEGTFIECGLCAEWSLTEYLTLQPYVLAGFNQGYVTDGHDGANHMAVGVETVWSISEHLCLCGSISYTTGIDKDAGRYPDDEWLRDRVYGRLGLKAAF